MTFFFTIPMGQGWGTRNSNPVWLQFKKEQMKNYCEYCGKINVELDLVPIPQTWSSLNKLLKPWKVITLCAGCWAMYQGKMIKHYKIKQAKRRSRAGIVPGEPFNDKKRNLMIITLVLLIILTIILIIIAPH
ncbi:MAG TPA: hypothetical protein VKM55_12235 [Candidatus Lokiarchaeia archaeon]|nr:hypothetical protein [Candidatus Lokiarchaeia archaeon]